MGGLLPGLDIFSPSDTSSTSQTSSQADSRRVNTISGGLSANDGSTLNMNVTDQGAMNIAGAAVSDSISLAKQIATTLGASVGQVSVGASNSVDSFTHLMDGQQKGIQTMGTQNNQITAVALAVAGVVAVAALRHGK